MNQSEIARALGRHRSTVCREVGRNSARADGHYRAFTAQERTNGRRSRSRRNSRFTAEDFALIDELLRRRWSPEQVSGYLARSGLLSISHETIYRHVWRDKKAGGLLYTRLRGAQAAAQALRRLRQPRPSKSPSQCCTSMLMSGRRLIQPFNPHDLNTRNTRPDFLPFVPSVSNYYYAE